MAIETHVELVSLCDRVKACIKRDAYEECMDEICYAMCQHPDAPEPHNLMGILMEKKSDHVGAMKHFRAALELDPTYLPAKENMVAYVKKDVPFMQGRFSFADCGVQKG